MSDVDVEQIQAKQTVNICTTGSWTQHIQLFSRCRKETLFLLCLWSCTWTQHVVLVYYWFIGEFTDEWTQNFKITSKSWMLETEWFTLNRLIWLVVLNAEPLLLLLLCRHGDDVIFLCQGLGRGAKQPFPSLGTFISTLSQRREVGGRGLAGGVTGGLSGSLGLRHGEFSVILFWNPWNTLFLDGLMFGHR